MPGQSIQRRIRYRENSAILVRDRIAADGNRINKTMDKLLKRKRKKFIVRKRARMMRRVEWKDKRSVRRDHRQLATTDAMGRMMKTLQMKRKKRGKKVAEIEHKLVKRKTKIWKVKLLTLLEGPVQRQKTRSSNLKRHWLKLKKGNWQLRKSAKQPQHNISPLLLKENSCLVLASISSANGGSKEMTFMSRWTLSFHLCQRNCLRSLMMLSITSRSLQSMIKSTNSIMNSRIWSRNAGKSALKWSMANKLAIPYKNSWPNFSKS